MNKLLILGGSNFIGRNLVQALVSIGLYDITLFNRGVTNSDLFPELRKIKGDRNTSDIHKVLNENWDYIIDLSCYFPDSLQQIVQHIQHPLKKYIFISTCSVYDQEAYQGIKRNEDTPILACTPIERTDDSPKTYGKRKAECERILIESNLNYNIFRPALVYGPYDPTDRFYYWLYQAKQNSLILLPEKGARKFSTTYVLDLVESIIRSINTNNQDQIFNVVSQAENSIKLIIEQASTILNKTPLYFNASADFLEKNDVDQWTDMPLWLSSEHYTYSNKKLLEVLKINLKEYSESLRTSISYYEKLNWPEPIYGMTDSKRSKLIDELTSSK